jgi:hypothetical protein
VRAVRQLISTPERRLLLIALLVRVIPAFLIHGTEDVSAWELWGRLLDSTGNAYHTRYLIAWPPAWLPFVSLAYDGAQMTGLPFHFCAKLMVIAADVVIVFVLYANAAAFGRNPFRLALCYALNPVAIYVSAIGGNFDAIPALCLTAAVLVVSCDADEGAVWLGIGAAFKTWPILMLPALVAPVRSVAGWIRVACLSIAIFVAAMLCAWPFGGWPAVIDIVKYRGQSGWWGISYLALRFGIALPHGFLNGVFYAGMAMTAIFLLVAKPEPVRGALLLLLMFFATTPAFGLQYLIWIVPVALLADYRHGILYSVLAGGEMAWEVLLRPFTGYIGETVRTLPHPVFARKYGVGADFTNTANGRLALWVFIVYWLMSAIFRTLDGSGHRQPRRDGRRRVEGAGTGVRRSAGA